MKSFLKLSASARRSLAFAAGVVMIITGMNVPLWSQGQRTDGAGGSVGRVGSVGVGMRSDSAAPLPVKSATDEIPRIESARPRGNAYFNLVTGLGSGQIAAPLKATTGTSSPGEKLNASIGTLPSGVGNGIIAEQMDALTLNTDMLRTVLWRFADGSGWD